MLPRPVHRPIHPSRMNIPRCRHGSASPLPTVWAPRKLPWFYFRDKRAMLFTRPWGIRRVERSITPDSTSFVRSWRTRGLRNEDAQARRISWHAAHIARLSNSRLLVQVINNRYTRDKRSSRLGERMPSPAQSLRKVEPVFPAIHITPLPSIEHTARSLVWHRVSLMRGAVHLRCNGGWRPRLFTVLLQFWIIVQSDLVPALHYCISSKLNQE
ncbi:uncharacterized protein B0T23DRAFT_155215 [Neurospora hispaniola]|uniref:Uncharacterized protein n=1 Tax=Neurospora hispaniola TaxID=588809 RepID=A0AAJ0MSA2_9PEZI|nr:hypothetical protein B0T23DRAFT_155215 [Neurospora hispaniola]